MVLYSQRYHIVTSDNAESPSENSIITLIFFVVQLDPICSPSDRVREKNKNCARFWGQIVRGKTPIVRELCGIAQSFDLPNIP